MSKFLEGTFNTFKYTRKVILDSILDSDIVDSLKSQFGFKN